MAVGHWAKGYLGDAGDGPAMNDIEGLDIQNPQDGQTIVYDAASGTWKNGEGSGGGGGGALVVNIFYDEDTEKFVADKTVNEILTAVNAGVFVYAYIDDDGTWKCLQLLYASVNGVTFCTVPTVDSSGVSQNTYAISSEGNEVTIEKKAYPGLI